jgi:hypothetical protein
MAHFQTKNPNVGKFLQWKILVYFMAIWSIFRPFGLFGLFVAIWYILWLFGIHIFQFWYAVPGKIWQLWYVQMTRMATQKCSNAFSF